MNIRSNASEIAQRFRYRIAKLRGGVTAGLRKWGAAVDSAQVDRLRGGSAPGDYPIPVRTGALLQGHFFNMPAADFAVVGNRSDHALAVHEGRYGNAVHGRRPFLDDAAAAVDGQAIMATELRRALQVP